MPVVVYTIKKPPFRVPKLPQYSEKSSKIISAVAAVVICITMVSFVAYSYITNTEEFKRSHNLNQNEQANGVTVSSAAAPGGGMAIGSGGNSGANSPVVSLTATPGSVALGGVSRLKWSVSNNPSSCTASDDWQGNKPASGDQNTPTLGQVQSYIFTLTCKNSSGTGYASVSVGATSQSGTGSAGRPTVTLAANPSAIFTGDKSTLIWSSTGNPTSCTAGGDWKGPKTPTSSENTPVLSIPKKYTYSLTCTNVEGTGTATATVLASTPPADRPNVLLTSNVLGSVKPGATVTLNWAATGNPTFCTAGGDWSGAKPPSGSENFGPLNTIKTYEFKITCSNSAGQTFDTLPVQVMPDPPTIAMTANPATVSAGENAVLAWSTTGNPTNCTAYGSWSGSKPAAGIYNTGALSTIKTYYYSLTCTNAAGTAFANNIPVRVVPPSPPVVNISIAPISTSTGKSAVITWTSSNGASSCNAGGDWSGLRAPNGSLSTGTLNTAKNYTYSLSCSNAGGSGTASVGLTVSAASTTTKPVVSVAINPTMIGTGSAATISWSVSNSPTSCTASGSWTGAKSASGSSSTGILSAAGNYNYTLACSNSAGSASANATLTVLATPVINISLNPATITSGGTSTLSWNVTNNPSSCTAGGSWSGSKPGSGSQIVNPPVGTYAYSLSCTNSGGTTTQSATLKVDQVTVVYCGGKTPCYGKSQMATHATIGNCWGWNLDWVLDITAYAPNHKGGVTAGNLQSTTSTCNHDIHAILTGAAAISGYRDEDGSSKHNHQSNTNNNGSNMASYFKGYYDPAKP